MSPAISSTHLISERHIMKKVLSTIATVALAAGLTLGIVAPASAHTGDMNVQAVCNTTTGQYDFTATLTVSRSGDKAGVIAARVGSEKFDGTPRNDKGMDFVTAIHGDGVYELPGFSLPGTTTGSGPWVYAFTSFDRPEQKNSFGSDGQLRYQLAGDCVVPMPDPKEPTVRFGEWVEASIECDATEVVTRRDVFTTSYVYDPESNSYVEGETVTTSEVSTRELTAEEVDANRCVIVPPMPDPEAVVSVTVGVFDCASTTVTDTITTTFVGHVLVDNVWVLNPLPSDKSTTELVVRDLTDEEIASLDCPVVPPVDPPVTDEEPFVPVQLPTLPAQLAFTGSSPLVPAGIASLLMAVGAFLIRRKARA